MLVLFRRKASRRASKHTAADTVDRGEGRRADNVVRPEDTVIINMDCTAYRIQGSAVRLTHSIIILDSRVATVCSSTVSPGFRETGVAGWGHARGKGY